MSNLNTSPYTLDHIALFDFPPALEVMRSHIGDRPIHVICHCLGAVSFTMSLFAKAVDRIASVIANSVALTPRVPAWSRVKLTVAPGMIDYVLGFPYINPRWSEDPGFTKGELFSRAVSFFHRECDVPACHMLSMMWGTGWPALYNHENMDPVTHRRGGDLYGANSMHYYRHVRKMLKAGHAVKYQPGDPTLDRLPDDYLQYAVDIETPILFTTGADNRVFADSNIVCYERLAETVPGRHELQVFPGYGHQDPFMGKHVDRDIFPRFVEFIDKHRSPSPVSLKHVDI